MDGKRGPRERHDGFTAAKKKICIEALAKTGTIADACRIARVSRRSFYYHRAKWRDFAAACEAALTRAAGAIETLAWDRATIGAEEMVMRGGKVVSVRRKPSDAMLRILLQASNPKKYGRLGRGGPTRRQIEKRLRKQIEAELRAEREREAEEQLEDLDEVRARLALKLEALFQRILAERASDAVESGTFNRQTGAGPGPEQVDEKGDGHGGESPSPPAPLPRGGRGV